MNSSLLQPILEYLSEQTGQSLPSAEQVERFLSSPSGQLLMQSVKNGQYPALSQAAAQAQSGDPADALQAVIRFLRSSDGQQLSALLNRNGLYE